MHKAFKFIEARAARGVDGHRGGLLENVKRQS
jgi:hypothetical protein